jgi:triacylglycerol lipase
MLAQLQRGITLSLACLAVLWFALCWRSGHPGWAALGVALLMSGHAFFLAAEFVWMHRANRDDAAPRPSLGQLLDAWWGEVRAAPLTFCWRQPFFSHRWPDHLRPAASGRRGVLLVHGFFCNRGLWLTWLARLRADDVPFVAVNLQPVFGAIDDYVDILDAAAQQLERATGLAPIVVAHSMGGLAVRCWLTRGENAVRAHHVITLGTPHHGTQLAQWAFSANGRQMRRDSRWLQSLRAAEAAQPGHDPARFTCYFSHCDNIVFPASTATLPGAHNRHLAGVAHVHMCARDEPYAELRRRLAPSAQASAPRADQTSST